MGRKEERAHFIIRWSNYPLSTLALRLCVCARCAVSGGKSLQAASGSTYKPSQHVRDRTCEKGRPPSNLTIANHSVSVAAAQVLCTFDWFRLKVAPSYKPINSEPHFFHFQRNVCCPCWYIYWLACFGDFSLRGYSILVTFKLDLFLFLHN